MLTLEKNKSLFWHKSGLYYKKINKERIRRKHYNKEERLLAANLHVMVKYRFHMNFVFIKIKTRLAVFAQSPVYVRE